MKHFVLFLFSALTLSSAVKAQTFEIDSVKSQVLGDGLANVYNEIHNLKSDSLIVKWNVTATDFPSDWYGVLGICDNITCYSPIGCWDTVHHTGPVHHTNGYPGGVMGDFHLQTDLTGKQFGTHYVSIYIEDDSIAANHANTRFIISHFPAGVSVVAVSAKELSVFPNPATNNATAVFTLEKTGDVNLAITNMLGQVVCKTTAYMNAGEQKLTINTTAIPAGLYNIKLQTATGSLSRQLSVVK